MSAASVTRVTGAVARHELRAFLRDGRILGAVALFVVLLGLALSSGARVARDYERVRAHAQAESHEQWLTQGEKNPHSAAHFGVYAFRPLGALGLFEPGVHAFEGTSVYLEAHKANDLRDAPAADASSLARLGGSSAAALLRTLLPLVLFMLAAPAIAGERERGTLKLLLAQGVSLRTLFWGKALALGVLLAGFLGVIVVLVRFFASFESFALDPVRTAWVLLGYGLYGLVLLGIGLSVSASAKGTRSALVSLLAIWSLLFLAAPRLAAYLTDAAAPLPLASTAHAALERDLDEEGYSGRMAELRAKTLARYSVAREEDLPIDLRGLSLQTDEERDQVIYQRHRDDLRAQFAAQDAWLDRASVAVVWLALERWSAALAGTDRRHVDDFADAAERHRQELVRRMNTFLMEHKGQKTADRALWGEVPPFGYAPPPPAFALSYAWGALVILLVWCAGTVACAELVVRRRSRMELET
ncbi:ABC transporter permease [Pendulispora rubella]|uniref:ABC transporter permease n=1 Tax=Pendulispora rubella TaxID=2741070 RepID=A0ABZ2LLB6_9BACT